MKWNEINQKETVSLQTSTTWRQIPKEIAEEAYKEYVAQYGDGQSFQRLQERGGFGTIEIIHLLYLRIKRLEGR